MEWEDQKEEHISKAMCKSAFGAMMKATLGESVKISPMYYNKE